MRTYATIRPGLRSTALSAVAALQRRWMCAGACLLLTIPAYAVDTLQVTTPDPVTEAWRWTQFSHGSGLAGNVRDIYEDRDGNIWFATDKGLESS